MGQASRASSRASAWLALGVADPPVRADHGEALIRGQQRGLPHRRVQVRQVQWRRRRLLGHHCSMSSNHGAGGTSAPPSTGGGGGSGGGGGGAPAAGA